MQSDGKPNGGVPAIVVKEELFAGAFAIEVSRPGSQKIVVQVPVNQSFNRQKQMIVASKLQSLGEKLLHSMMDAIDDAEGKPPSPTDLLKLATFMEKASLMMYRAYGDGIFGGDNPGSPGTGKGNPQGLEMFLRGVDDLAHKEIERKSWQAALIEVENVEAQLQEETRKAAKHK